METEELYALDTSTAQWRKSRRSAVANDCVELARLDGGVVVVRDSKNPSRGDLRFTPQEWAAFRDGVRDGEFG